MSLAAGARLAHYQILEPIGQGGMGEVYRARDGKLGRDVAIKVLTDEFANDTERLARFEREAKLLASLNHPNIASIYGFEEADGVSALVLELVEGPTLAERIAEGPIPVAETIAIAGQIAEALEAGHEAGVIHRDLKPANVKVREDGTVKVLDYGLAKAFEGDAPTGADSDLSQSPTLTRHGTRVGVILGTASYMSPEQARGKAVDQRTDIWAFGCCLYEALTGEKAFTGETVTDTLARIVERAPDWEALPENTPRSMRRLLDRCLRKSQQERLKSAGDIALGMRDDVGEESMLTAEPRGPERRWPTLALAAAIVGVVAGYMLRYNAADDAQKASEPSHWTVALPPGASIREEGIDISSDGRLLVAAVDHGGGSQLYLKAIDNAVLEPIPGTEDGFAPFFSPDGEWVGFFARGRLQKIRIDGGRAIALCGYSRRTQWATWGVDGTIIYRGWADAGLVRCPADGGEPEVVTQKNRQIGESVHLAPTFLPNGSILFGISGGALAAKPSLALLPHDSDVWFPLPVDGRAARYVPPGYLVYEREGRLLAAAFDPTDPTRIGRETILVDGLYDLSALVPAFAVSAAGTLAFLPGSAEQNQLVYVDREGRVMSEIGEPGLHMYPRLSPKGDAALVSLMPRLGDPRDIWVYDTVRGSRTRLTFGMTSYTGAWSPDGRHIAFQSSSSDDRRSRIYTIALDGTGTPDLLAIGGDTNSWSPDGHTLLVGKGTDVWELDVNGGRELRPLLNESYGEYAAVFSPDGQWIAYTSDESERNEIYVRRYPGPGRKYAVSTNGGNEPVWSRDGRELFFRTGSTMMVVDVHLEPEFQAGELKELFQGNFRSAPAANSNYDVSPDGSRFLMVRPTADAPREIHVIVNWLQELEPARPPRPLAQIQTARVD